MIDKEFIDRIVDLSRANNPIIPFENGRSLISAGYAIVEPKSAEPLVVNTLTGFIAAINQMPKDLAITVNIRGDFTADAMSSYNPETKKRDYYFACQPIKSNNIPTLQGYNNFNFVTAVKESFRDTPERERLLQYVSKVTSTESLKTEDDGVTQSTVVSTSRSGALVKREKAPAFVHLDPWQPYPEIEPVKALYSFRINSNSYDLQIIAAHFYKTKVIELIRKYLRTKGLNVL